jgi:hypothetical protein
MVYRGLSALGDKVPQVNIQFFTHGETFNVISLLELTSFKSKKLAYRGVLMKMATEA